LAIVQELTHGAMGELRSLIFELRPAELSEDGLASTLRKHVHVLRRVYGKEIDLEVDGQRPLGPELEKEIFRIAQEALANALKHAEPERVEVRLELPDQRLRLTVVDDGTGFDPRSPQVGKRLGLSSMRERAEALGGELVVSSRPGAGTTITLEVDLGGRDPRRDR
jgi:signal transduction histidine kinase